MPALTNSNIPTNKWKKVSNLLYTLFPLFQHCLIIWCNDIETLAYLAFTKQQEWLSKKLMEYQTWASLNFDAQLRLGLSWDGPASKFLTNLSGLLLRPELQVWSLAQLNYCSSFIFHQLHQYSLSLPKKRKLCQSHKKNAKTSDNV